MHLNTPKNEGLWYTALCVLGFILFYTLGFSSITVIQRFSLPFFLPFLNNSASKFSLLSEVVSQSLPAFTLTPSAHSLFSLSLSTPHIISWICHLSLQFSYKLHSQHIGYVFLYFHYFIWPWFEVLDRSFSLLPCPCLLFLCISPCYLSNPNLPIFRGHSWSSHPLLGAETDLFPSGSAFIIAY